ncbi:NUDIX hydrolase [Sulfoacidibacillus ferrooxidans]|uniref:Nudix hydrolase domain-containing protein n=1 Tax=Sulfoacidibacillus ferrooxidans TaxID=2005001 RepID=A0A9X2AAM5_9BACL|nr:NUDIX hydrolase [Sulfoacidibacillus ferrooxidans]MCI0182003.1 hypothetical protein [Sulfoacidibacillus ferrooxidans]
MSRHQGMWWQSFSVFMARILPSQLLKTMIYTLKKKYVIGVVAIVFNSNGELLILHHTYRKEFLWRLPGGLKEATETPFETVVRELQEEANLQVEPLFLVALAQATISLDVAVLCKVVSEGEFVANPEVSARKWVDPREFMHQLPSEQQGFVVEALRLRALGIMNWGDHYE